VIFALVVAGDGDIVVAADAIERYPCFQWNQRRDY
jgi:hypothetical protein